MPHRHRSGGLRQSNKRHSRSKASKRSLSRAAGGRVGNAVARGPKQLASKSKADRRHMAQQRRDAKRKAVIDSRRHGSRIPRVVGILSLAVSDPAEVEERVRQMLLQQANHVVEYGNKSVTLKFDEHKKDGIMTILSCSTAFPHQSRVTASLDLCRVCDIVLFALDGDALSAGGAKTLEGMNVGEDVHSLNTKASATSQNPLDPLIAEDADEVLSAVKAQGLPMTATVLLRAEPEVAGGMDDAMSMVSTKSIRRGLLKQKMGLKRYVSRFASTEFGEGHDKVIELDSEWSEKDVTVQTNSTRYSSSPNHMVRTISTMTSAPAKWVNDMPRSYLLSDRWEYKTEEKEFVITGYIRGKTPFDVNALVHVPRLGTFSCKNVAAATAPFSHTKTDSAKGIIESDPDFCESLNMFATPDALEGEQNLIGFDDIAEEDQDVDDNFARPAGWSDYQSAWLDGVDDVQGDDFDHGELALELNKKPSDQETGDIDMMEANDVTSDERMTLAEQRRKEENEDLQFPDEVEVKEDEKAQERLARYRSLKSFRKSYWDPKENLPESYGKSYHFSNFKATQRNVMKDMRELVACASANGNCFWGKSTDIHESEMEDDEDEDTLLGCVPSGSYVTLTLENVPVSAVKCFSPASLVTAVSLLQHENKMSVLHMAIRRTNDFCSEPIKGKDILTFRCGWRTWQSRPVFSQYNLNSDKHKMERFMPAGSFFAATVFGPVTYTPCPILVFRNDELVATGSMLGADADRIIIKRVVLTGFPTRVHKRHAVVKYMFYNPEDVKWFRPAELTTKHGLNGNIIESVGEHGTMKCLFNAPIKQHDTVCLPLYKRVHPKFAPVEDRDGLPHELVVL